MTTTVTFDIGGLKYTVSKSLLEGFPHSMLFAAASKVWHENPEEEIFIDRNGKRFEYVLDYLRDGKVFIPCHEIKESIVAELQYYNIEVDADCIHFAKEGNSIYVVRQIHSLIMRCHLGDLAAELMTEILKDKEKWRGKGGTKTFSFKPQRYNECIILGREDCKMYLNDLLLKVGVKVIDFSMSYNSDHPSVSITVQPAGAQL